MTAGKGSRQRPTDAEAFNKNFDAIFRKCPDCGKPLSDGLIHTCSPQEKGEPDATHTKASSG